VDSGAYQFVVTNSGVTGGTIQSNMTTAFVSQYMNIVGNTFVSNVVYGNYGAVALWPLEETTDPSTGTAVAYDIIGGFNGIYGTNARNGGVNSGSGLPAVPGPAVGGAGINGVAAGLPTGGALGVTNRAQLAMSFVTTEGSPTFPYQSGSYGTNVTIVGWVYPTSAPQPNGNAGIFMTPNAEPTNTYIGGDTGMMYGNNANTLGYRWDNNSGTASGFSGPVIIPFIWNMAALVITPTNSTFYVANASNGMYQITQWMTNGADVGINTNQLWGGIVTIGTDVSSTTPPGKNINGYLSSFAMFNNSLTPTQIETLFNFGEGGPIWPVIETNTWPSSSATGLLTNYLVPGGVSDIFTAAGYGGLNSGAYWATNNGSAWVQMTAPPLGITNSVVANGADWVGTLQVTNFQLADVNSYALVVYNTLGQTNSLPVVILPYTNFPVGGFISQATNSSYGIVALWPLNETNDPSQAVTNASLVAVAYDIIGGFNGTYGTNADTGGGNARYLLPPVVGPGLSGVAGLPTNGAFGVTNATALATSYITTTTSPFFTNITGICGTNVSIVGWIYPTSPSEATETGLFLERSGDLSAGNTAGLQYGGTVANTIGLHWDSDAGNMYSSGWQNIPSNMWNMIGLVVTPSNFTFYVANTNQGMVTNGYITNNMNVPWGKGLYIGTDPQTIPGRNFVGYMSSFAMFTNSLTLGQMEGLYAAGMADGQLGPVIITNIGTAFLTNYLVTNGTSTKISAIAYGTNVNGYWQILSGGNWVNLNPGTDFGAGVTSTAPVPGAVMQQVGTLQIINFQAADAGSYRLIFTNSGTVGGPIIYATSSVVTLLPVTPVAGSFALAALTNGAAAFWPLTETNDTSFGTAVAWDIVGGFNGIYGTNAMSGGRNSLDSFAPTTGPAAPALAGFAALTGFPSGSVYSALGSLQNVSTNPATFVTLASTPTLPYQSGAFGTNATIVAWVYPNTSTEANQTGIFLTRSNYLGSTNTAGMQILTNSLGAYWGTNAVYGSNYPSGLPIPANVWSMLAVVITPSNNYFYVCNTSNGMISSIENMENASATVYTNSHIGWGGGAVIGTDPASEPGRNFGGLISSVVFFTNSLNAGAIETLFDAGLTNDTQYPFITVNPPGGAVVLQNLSKSFIAAGYGGSNASGYWQMNTVGTGGNWVTMSNGIFNNNSDVFACLVATNTNYWFNVTNGGVNVNPVPGGAYTNVGNLYTTLTFTNFKAKDTGSYQLVITNSRGAGGAIQTAMSSVLVLNVVNPGAGSFAAGITNNSLGMVAYWPLNETVDPSGGTAVAYELMNGYNGTYGTNANNGGGNTIDGFSAVPGPGTHGAPGLPTQGALGTMSNNIWTNTYVTIPVTPTLTNSVSGTNMTILGWIYPTIPTETVQAGLISSSVPNSSSLSYANWINPGTARGVEVANGLGYQWNNAEYAYDYNSGLAIPANMWSLVAMVVSPSNVVLYVGNTNQGLNTATEWYTNGPAIPTNIFEAWGGATYIGEDHTYNALSRNFVGYLSSFAMFSNSLTASNMEVLFDAGVALGNNTPIITANPLSVELIQNISPPAISFTSGAFGGYVTNGGFWQVSTTPGMWNNLANSSHIAGAITPVNTSWTGQTTSTLWISNATSADVASYQFVMTNWLGLSATSAVATLTYIANPYAAGSFGGVATANSGLVALWPLNETGDPSTGTVEAYDIVGGFDGLYGINAADGGVNSADGFAAVSGPGAAAFNFTGLPSSALGSLQGGLLNTFVTTPYSPATAAANTNMTIIAWVYPMTNEAASTGVLVERTASQTNGLVYGTITNELGYIWNAGNAAYNVNLQAPTNEWSMLAMVVTSTNTTLFVANTNSMQGEILLTSNAYQAWGQALSIGGDPGAGATASARSFGGDISSVAIFNNALSGAGIEGLFLAGFSQGQTEPLPVITIQPPAATMQLFSNINATIYAAGFGYGAEANGYWQYQSPGNMGTWVTLTNGGDNGMDVAGGATTTLTATMQQQGALQFTNLSSLDVGSYQLVISNTAGTATSSVVALSLIAPPLQGSFAASILNYGAVAFWPLNETNDPSAPPVTAYDVIGGFNGVYGTNAQDGSTNNGLGNLLTNTYPANVAYYFSPVQGPSSLVNPTPYIGLPVTAYGGIHNLLNNTFVTTATGPSFAPNQTNQTVIAWIYPTVPQTSHQGIWTIRSAIETVALSTGVTSGQLNYNWDNNSGATTGFNSANLAIPTNAWTMVALVITPTNSTLFVGTSNLLLSASQTINNINEPGGAPIYIGTDPNALPGDSFGGAISSVAMFSNALTAANLETLWLAGQSEGLTIPPPYIVSQPAFSYLEVPTPGGNFTLSATGFGVLPAGGNWQVFSNNVWTNVTSPDIVAGTAQTTLQNTLLVGALQFNNFGVSDAGSYRLLITNSSASGSLQYATSSVVTLNGYNVTPGSFAALVLTNGVMSFWPLNETNDPSSGITGPKVVAYDIVGAYNGTYGTNADNGGGNSTNGLAPVAGPGAAGFIGLPSSGALGVTNIQALASSFVTVLTPPTFPANKTNATFLAWIYPTTSEAAPVGLVTQDAAQKNGLWEAPAANNLGFDWDNNGPATGTASYAIYSGLVVPTNTWSLVGMVVTPTNTSLYVANTNNGLSFITTNMPNTYVNWGNVVEYIGADQAAVPARNFAGYMSSVAILSNSLSITNIENLFAAGLSNGIMGPFITTNPAPITEGMPGISVTLTAAGYVGTNNNAGTAVSGWWQANYGNGWVSATVNVNSNAFSNSGSSTNAAVANGIATGVLQLTNVGSAASGVYEFVISNAFGVVYSTPANVTVFPAAAGSYAAAATNPALGIVGFWPLNETNDPSTGTAIAYELINGYNGYYLTNAQNGGTNSYIYNNDSGYLMTNNGPILAGMTGLTTNAASLADLQNNASLPNSYIIVSNAPVFPPGTNNNTNVTMIAWIYPAQATEGSQTGLIANNRPGGIAASFSYGNTGYGAVDGLGWQWDNWASTYDYDSSLVIPPYMWSMVAMSISPTNVVFFVANTNEGMLTTTYWITNSSGVGTNVNQPWGTNVYIGTDPYSIPARNFGGYMSCVTMFSNTLNITNMEILFDAGLALGTNAPFVTANPLATNKFLQGAPSATLNAAAYVGTNGQGIWQISNSVAGWQTVNSPEASGINGTFNNGMVTGNLAINGFQSQDAGLYRMVFYNTNGSAGGTLSATSSVVSLQFYNVKPNTFASVLTNTAYGAVAFWPLDETNIDPSTGLAVAYDVIGGHNGIYQTNAQNGAPNTGVSNQLYGTATWLDYLGSVQGPGNSSNALTGGLVFGGLPTTAFSPMNSNLNQCLVTTTTGPVFPANSTNATFVVWVYPNANMAAPGCYLSGGPNYCQLIDQVSGEFGATSTDGAQLDVLPNGSGNLLVSYNWDNNLGADNAYRTGMMVPFNTWSMYAFAISPSNTTFFLGNTNGLFWSVQTQTHTYVPWSAGMSIGGDAQAYPGGATAYENFFQGQISSVVMFTNTLTPVQISTLFEAGGSNMIPPFIVTNPPPSEILVAGAMGTMNAAGYAGPNANGYWRKTNANGSLSLPGLRFITNTSFANGIYQEGLLTISNFQAADAGSYIYVCANSSPTPAYSTPVVLQLAQDEPVGGFVALAASPAYGAVALWPLDETNADPSTGTAVAYDIIGGYNGIYGTNANNGFGNQGPAANLWPYGATLGPSSPFAFPLPADMPTGLPTNGSLGSFNGNATYPDTYVSTTLSPTFATNSTNMTMVAWIMPTISLEPSQTAIVTTRGNGQVNGMYYGNTAEGNTTPNTLGWTWANSQYTYYYNSSLTIPSNVWSMVAVVVTPSNAVFYVGSTNGMVSTNQPLVDANGNPTNTSQPWGGFVTIGADGGYAAGIPGRNFGGDISCVTLFSNALSPVQIENLYDAGMALGSTNMPEIVSGPAFPTNAWGVGPSYELIPNGSASISVLAYTGPVGGAYWQTTNSSGNWVNLFSADAKGTNFLSSPNTVNLQCTLFLHNVTANDAGLYQLVVTNVNGSVTSAAVSVTLIAAPAANTFEGAAISMGAVALWPLNETSDPGVTSGSTPAPVTEAYDIIGGWNGIYGLYSVNGFGNSGLGQFSGIAGPEPPAQTGFPNPNYALFTTNVITGYESSFNTEGAPSNATVITAGSPSLPANDTNMTIVAWIYPTAAIEPADAGIVFMRTGQQVDGLCYGNAYGGNTYLGNDWNNGNQGNETFIAPPEGAWSMVAMVVTSTNTTLYICDPSGVFPVEQTISNAYQSWGGSIDIGGDPRSAAGAYNFNGDIAEVTMFTNALSFGQIATLYYAGLDSGSTVPVISEQPLSSAAYESRTVSFSVLASGTGTLGYEWQVNYGSGWVYLTNGSQTLSGEVINGANSSTLSVTAWSTPGQPGIPTTASFQVIITNAVGNTTSAVVTLTDGAISALSGYAQAVTNLNPVGYWELNEVSGTVAYDYWGGFSGTYGAGVTVAGAIAPDQLDYGFDGTYNGSPSMPLEQWLVQGVVNLGANAPEFTNTFVNPSLATEVNGSGTILSNLCATNSFVSIPALNLNTNVVSIIMWINPNEIQSNTPGLFYCRTSGTTAGFGFAGGNSGALGYNWGDNAATYNYNSGLVPLVSNWNLVGMVLTSTNTTFFCYNTNTQTQVVQTVANTAIEPWDGIANIGNDMFNSAGLRQFDGAIAEVAIFNKALTVDQINYLWETADGVALGPVFSQAPTSATANWVNEGGSPAYTATVVNGPNLGITWWGPLAVITNGNNGYPGSWFTITTVTNPGVGLTSTMTISNLQPSMTGASFFEVATNFATNSSGAQLPTTPSATATSPSFTLPALFGTPALWTVDISGTNTAALTGNYTDTGFHGLGLISSGTIWNYIDVTGATGYLTNWTSTNDTGTITNTGVTVYVDNAAGASASPTSGDANAPLFDLYQNLPTTANGSGIIVQTQPGFYNLFIYSLVGTYSNRGTTFTVHGIAQNVQANGGTGGGPGPNMDAQFYPGTNMTVFTNVFITNGTLNIGTAPYTTQPTFNGIQVQLISPYSPLKLTMSNSTPILTYAGCTLESSTDLKTWTPVFAGGSDATTLTTNTYAVPALTIPGGKPSAAIFYIAVPTSPVSGLPWE
jgi:hypothetical protein